MFVEKSLSILNRNSWFLFFVVLILEYLLFRTYIVRDVIDFYPTAYDQAAYLSLSYSLYEKILNNSFGHTLAESLFSSPQSLLFPIQAAVFFLFSGASRMAALNINFIYFAVLQIFSFKTAHSLTKRFDLSFLLLGLILALNTPFFWAGGLIDFRIDFAAFCLYGIFVTAIIQSKVFLDRKWTLIATLLAVLLVLTRSISAIYLTGIFLSLLILFSLVFLLKKNTKNIVNINKRFFNLFLSGSIGLVFITPFLWFARQALYNYYIVGHLTGIEKNIRANEFGAGELFFYFNSLLNDHLGYLAICIFIGILLFSAFLFLIKRTNNLGTMDNEIYIDNFIFIISFLLIAIIVPLLVLMLNAIKSPVVVGIVTIPVCWLVFIIFTRFFNESILTAGSAISVSLLVFLLGFFHFLSGFAKHDSFHFNENNMQDVTRMYENIDAYFQKLGLDEIYYAFDQNIDYFFLPVVNVIAYENSGNLPRVKGTALTSSIFDIDLLTAKNALLESNVYITNINNNYFDSPYLFNQSMKVLHPELMNIAKERFIVLGDYYFDNYHFRVFVKSDNPVKTFSKG